MKKSIGILIWLLFFTLSFHILTASKEESKRIDSYSYNLGVIAAFAEVVNLGIKKMALSAALPPQEMAQLLPAAQKVAQKNGALIYLETDFLVTDLFAEEVTRGKHVLVIYQGETLKEYLNLKKEKAYLIQSGKYKGQVRKAIAEKMASLLSYPPATIQRLLKKT